jgi:response regulator RpfG family c-di-GMP phosphodiesterase
MVIPADVLTDLGGPKKAIANIYMRILIVEDERKVASFIARTLRENAYAVDVADTGEKAL